MSDLIDRQKAIEALQKEIDKGKPPFNDTIGAIRCGVRLARNIIEDLPSAQPVAKDINVPCTDTISRQAAIEAVLWGITHAKAINKDTGEVIELFRQGNEELTKAADRIKNLPSVQEQRWIPETERLPEEGGKYIVTRISAEDGVGRADIRWYSTFSGWEWDERIIAWMPIPEPYKGEK